MKVLCPTCKVVMDYAADKSSKHGWSSSHRCGPGHPATTKDHPRPWSNAKSTRCSGEHVHASKMEARVCERLTLEVAADCVVASMERHPTLLNAPLRRLLQQVRLALLNLPLKDGKVRYLCVDFLVVDEAGRILRAVDAKTKGRVSRDWPARKRACELCWGIEIEEVDR